MRNFDLAPLYRATVGYDRVADLMNRVSAADITQPSYPPYNIEKTAENGYRISIAVAGFGGDDLTVEVKENTLFVAAKKAGDDTERAYLHRGIANRSFERRFHLADHVRVAGATHADGMLHIELLREVPEASKPRRIEIGRSGDIEARVISNDATAPDASLN